MARQKGTLVLSANFEIKAAAPLDSRYTVQTEADLTASASWVADGSAYIYKGMQVYVINSSKLYMLIDEDYTKMSSWIELSGIPASCLSYKGDVATFGDLPDTGLTTGDVYYVEDEVVNYYWDGDSWKALGSPDKSSFIWKCSTALNPIPTNTNVLISNLKRIDDNTITCVLDDLKVGKTIISDNSGMLGVVIGTTKTTTDNDTAVIATLTESDYYKKDEIDDLLDLKADKATTYTKTEVDDLLDDKVDKEAGKGLSTNDFTDAYKDKLDDLENYDDTEVRNLIDTKVDKVAGKQLSTEDYTTAEKTKLAGIEEGAQVNKLEKIKLNGVDISIDPLDKSSNIILPATAEYEITEVTPTTGYAKSYQLEKDGVQAGVKIDIPKDLVVKSGEIKTVTEDDEPYEGAVVGDKYIDLTLNDPSEDHIYIPVGTLVSMYTAGNGIDITSNVISIKLNNVNSNGLNTSSEGLGLNTVTEVTSGAMTPTDKVKLNSLENYDDSDIQAAISNKVDKETGKGLSSNDFTDELKRKLEEAVAYDDTAIRNLIALKVDKEAGKGLSTNDFTNADKTKLDSLENYDDSEIYEALDNKVDKVPGKQLSTEDYTTVEKEKLTGIESGAEVNTIETVKVDGVALTPDANRAVDIELPAYTMVKNVKQSGYPQTYNLTKDGVNIGDTIEIPDANIIRSGEVEVVTQQDVPYEGARIGDKYIDMELETDPVSHIYIPLKDLATDYKAGDGIDIDGAHAIRVITDSTLRNGLQVTERGLGLNLATISKAGAMSGSDKYKLDNLSNYDDSEIRTALNNKVDKVAGKQLSTEDYTTAEKTKLASIERGAQVNVIETVKVNNQIVGPVDKTISLDIPTKVSQLTNDMNFIADANYNHTDNNYTDSEKNKLASLTNYNDSEIRGLIDGKQDELVSGTNIKTINGESLLGSGNIEITADDKLKNTLTTNIKVGWCESGTTFASGTPLETILRTILYKDTEPTPTTNYTVSFNTYGGSTISSQIVEQGGKATRPSTDPTRSGYTFNNWYTSSTYTTLYDFNNTVNSDTIIHAKWEPIPLPEYTVSFNTYGGSEVASQTVTEGSKASRPSNPTKENNTFDNWYTSNEYTTVFNFNTPITGNTTVHAKWTPVVVNHTVTFYGMNNEILYTQTVEHNTRCTRPSPDPTKEGYTFDNWYTSNSYTDAFDFRTYILADTAVFARFTEVPVVDNYDLYIGGFDNATCSTAAIFATKTADQLVANVIEQHMVDESQPFITTLSWSGDGSKNVIYYIMLKDGVEPAGATLTSLGVSSDWTGDEIKDSTYWRATHDDIEINGINYKVYGLRGKFNNDDTIALYIEGSTPTTSYTVTFNTHDGSSVPSQTVEDGYTATRPNNPTKSGYVFDNWYTTDSYTTLFDFTTAIHADTTVHAKWNQLPEYTVSFNSHGGSTVANQTVYAGNKATRPSDPTRSGYIFNNWYTTDSYTTLFDFNSAINADTTVHAKWDEILSNYTVSFNTYGGSTINSQTVQSGSTATRPSTDPTKSGYTFDDWYTSNAYTTKFNFSTPITGNTVVHAKWNEVQPTTHTVSFNTYGGSSVSSQTINDGSTATKPTNPTKSGYTFDNWYTSSAYTTKFNFSTPITADITLHAKWNEISNKHTVTFYDMEGGVISTVQVDNNTRVTRPTDPTPPTGKVFDNWYTDTTYTTAFDFRTYILADTGIYARFEDQPVVDSHDLYIGGMDNATASTAAIFAKKTVDQLLANVLSEHDLGDTQPFRTVLTFAGDASKNVIYYVMIKDGVEPAGAQLTSAGITSGWTAEEIKDSTYWRATHSDVQINNITYKVYGLRGKFNNDDFIDFTIE